MNTTTIPTTTPPPVSPRHHYAVRWPFGIATHANTGHPLRRVARFTDPAARDEWVYQGKPHRNSANFREIVTRREVEPDIRRAERLAENYRSPLWMDGDDSAVEWLF